MLKLAGNDFGVSGLAGCSTSRPIQPYYEDSDITIFNGKCGDVLPSLECVDLLLTDAPRCPLGLSDKNKQRMKEGHKLAPQATQIGTFPDNELLLAISKARDAIVWNDSRYPLPESQELKWFSRGFYVAGQTEYDERSEWVIRHFLSKYDLVSRAWFKVEPPTFLSSCQSYDWMGMLTECLGIASNADTILDPFMGQGDVMVAAIQLGRKFIGIEVQEERCQKAVARISQIRRSD